MVQKDILATILINNFNNQKFLKKCISSCLAQSYKNIEIIVFDNVSSDNSSNILKKFEGNIIVKSKSRISEIAAENQIDLLMDLK